MSEFVYVNILDDESSYKLALKRHHLEAELKKFNKDDTGKIKLYRLEIERNNKATRQPKNETYNQLMSGEIKYIVGGDSNGIRIADRVENQPLSYSVFKKMIKPYLNNEDQSDITSNTQLENIAKMLDIPLSVVISLDKLVDKKIEDNTFTIVNISRKVGEVGHWVLCASRDDERIYFDSFGIVPPPEIVEYLNHDYQGNDAVQQKITAEDCGIRCLFIAFKYNQGNEYRDLLFDLNA